MNATTRTPRGLSRSALITAAGLLLLSGCGGSDPMTEDDIIERVATAQREAPSFTFEWTSPETEEFPVTEGAIRYDDDGNVDLLTLVMRDQDDTVALEARWVDGTFYERQGGAGEFAVIDDPDDRATYLEAWDWAGATEHWGDPESVEELGETDVEGTSTVEYEVHFEEEVHRWWIDGEDRLLRMETGQAGTGGFLRDWGDEVEVQVPENIADR